MVRALTVTPRTVELFGATHPEILLEGGVGGGKTFSGAVLIDQLCRVFPGIRILLVRQTRISLNNSVLDTLESEVWGQGHPVLTPERARSSRQSYDYPEAETVVDGRTYRGKSRIDLGGMDNPDRIMSTQYDVIWAVEAVELLQSAWERLSTRVRRFYVMRKGRPFSLMIADCNPGPRRHWLNLRADRKMDLSDEVCAVLGLDPVEARSLPQMQRVRVTIRDNPKFYDAQRGTWTEEGAEYMRRLGGLSPLEKARLVDGLWVDVSGQVYTDFKHDQHIVEGDLVDRSKVGKREHHLKWWLKPTHDEGQPEPFTLRPVAYFVISTDYGFNPDPGVIQLWAVDEQDHAFRVKVWYETRRTFDDWAKLIVELQGQYDVRSIVTEGGEHTAKTLNDLLGSKLNSKGQPIAIAAAKGPGSIKSGIDKVRWALKPDETTGEPKVRFLAGALQNEPDRHLEAMFWPTSDVQEFDRYAYPEAKEDKPNKDVPIDMHNHGMDALRYFVSYTWGTRHSAPEEPTPPRSVYQVQVGLTEADIKRQRRAEAAAMRRSR